MASVVFAYRFEFYVSSTGGDPYPIIANFDIDGGDLIYLRGPDSGIGGELTVVINAVEYTVAGHTFLPDTWYQIEMKVIKTGTDITVYLKPTSITQAGPYPPSSTEPSNTFGYLGGTLFLQHFSPGLGVVSTAPLLLANAAVAQGDWVSNGGIVLFTDSFDVAPGSSDTFVPPWDLEDITTCVNPFPDSGHIVDPADAGRYVGCLSCTGNFINVGFTTEDLPAGQSATISHDGGIAE